MLSDYNIFLKVISEYIFEYIKNYIFQKGFRDFKKNKKIKRLCTRFLKQQNIQQRDYDLF